MKKILSLVLVAAMMLSMVALAPSASAETGVTLEVTDAVASKGDTVTLDIILSGTVLGAFGLVLDYDTSRLENAKVTVNTETGMGQGLGFKGYDYAGVTFDGNSTSGQILDYTEPTVLATVTLDVKADAPAGDAFVRVSDIPDTTGMVYLRAGSNPSDNIYDWNVVDGIVTVLPEGYTQGTAEAPVADFTYTIEDAENATITAYTGTASEILFPSFVPDGEGNPVPVTKIGSQVFISTTAAKNYTITKVIVPESVVEIESYAFLNLYECYNVFVYNADCVIGDYAIGYEGATYSSKKKAWDYSKVALKTTIIDEEEMGSVIIHCLEGSLAYDYTQEFDPDYYLSYNIIDGAPTVVTVVAGDNTSAFEVSGNTITAPGASRADGRVTVAWDVNGTKVAPGAEVAIDGDTTFTAITVAAPETTNGASIKAADGYAALRFTAEFSVAEYEALVAAFGAKNVKHGMLISTQDQIKAAGEFTHKLAKKIDFEMKGCWKVEDGNYVFAASVKNFSDSTLAKNYKFNAVAYVGIDLDGNGTVDTYVYGDYDWTCARDAKTVLANAIENAATSGLVGDQLTWAEAWFGKFN